MSQKRDTANQMQYGVAGPGANPVDTGPMQLQHVKARFPAKHGQDVLDDHLAWSSIVVPVGQQHVQAPVLDEGSGIIAYQLSAQPGTNHAMVAGTVPAANDPGGGTPGNNSFNWLFEKRKNGAGTKSTPNSKRVGSVFEIVEKGLEHSLSLLNNLPSHGAMPQITGLKNAALESVATAKEQHAKILTPEMLSKIPGSNFNMGELLNNLTSTQQNNLFSDMPRQIQEGLVNALGLMQNDESADTGGFMTSSLRVNPEVFLDNAVETLKGATSVQDLMDGIQTLTSDESLRGLDQLEDVKIETEGVFGNYEVILSANGSVSIEMANNVVQAVNDFSNQMGALPGAGGTSGGMFSGSALKDMMNRLPKEEMQKFKDMMQKNVDSGGDPRSKLNNMLKKALPEKTFPFQ